MSRCTWVWVNSRSWWRTGRPGMLRFMGLQSRTQLSNWTECLMISIFLRLPWWLRYLRNCLHCARHCGFNPWVGKIPWRRERQPTLVLLPGEFHGQRRLVGYSQSMGLQKVRRDWATTHFLVLRIYVCVYYHFNSFTHCNWAILLLSVCYLLSWI